MYCQQNQSHPHHWAELEAAEQISTLRGILLARDVLRRAKALDEVERERAIADRLAEWTRSATMFLELAYRTAQTLVGQRPQPEVCQELARERLNHATLDGEKFAAIAKDVEEAAYILRAGAPQRPPDPPDRSCGPLRREGDGTWWYDELYLGTDGGPSFECFELARNTGMVTLRLYEALKRCSERLQTHGEPGETEILTAFAAWRATGKWPRLREELQAARGLRAVGVEEDRAVELLALAALALDPVAHGDLRQEIETWLVRTAAH